MEKTMKYETSAKRLRLALERKGMIAQELADRTGIHKSSISQYVNGSHIPSNIRAGKIAAVLGVSPAWLMGFDVPMFEQEKPSGVMGHTAERNSLYIQEAEIILSGLNEDFLKRAIAYLEGLHAIQRQEEELKKG